MPKIDIRARADQFSDKLKNIKVALFDVDGICTDGKIFWAGEEVGFNRMFHTHDGYGMKILMRAGLKVGIITGGNSIGVKKRFELLGLDYIYMGNEDKRGAFEEVMEKAGVSDENVLYMGDEFFDLPLLKRAGFSATVPTASHEICDIVDYVTHANSGEGCVREVIDMLRHVQGIVPEIEF
jgi:3-deoxy-D-manno-octulosonate 8-phosphate phosphatase (KDO 8-P phosphatase)